VTSLIKRIKTPIPARPTQKLESNHNQNLPAVPTQLLGWAQEVLAVVASVAAGLVPGFGVELSGDAIWLSVSKVEPRVLPLLGRSVLRMLTVGIQTLTFACVSLEKKTQSQKSKLSKN